MTLTPAYGRDYKSKKAVLEAFDAGKDFIVADMFSPWDGKPASKSDLKAAGIRSVQIRYKALRSVAVVNIK